MDNYIWLQSSHFLLIWTRVELGGGMIATRNYSLKISEMGKQTKWDINLKGMKLGMQQELWKLSHWELCQILFTRDPVENWGQTYSMVLLCSPALSNFISLKMRSDQKRLMGNHGQHHWWMQVYFLWQMVGCPDIPFLQVLEKYSAPSQE